MEKKDVNKKIIKTILGYRFVRGGGGHSINLNIGLHRYRRIFTTGIYRYQKIPHGFFVEVRERRLLMNVR
jgi:hypothetical protein